MKGNEHKKLTYEDKFSRHFACWVKNNRKAWMWFKKQNRRKYRRMLKRRDGDAEWESTSSTTPE